MKKIDLNGAWQFKAVDKYRTLPKDITGITEWMNGTVPGTVHMDLMANGKIPDPFYRMNEDQVQWVDSQQWVYRRDFEPTWALSPRSADCFGNEAYSTKIMEFMSLGVPTVVSSTKIDRFYFDDSVVRFFESGNVDALSDAMLEIIRDRQLRRRMTANGLDYVTP